MKETFAAFALGILGITILAVFMAWPTQWLWNNCLVSAIDGVNSIGFWQALGINFLSSVLFKSSNSKTTK